MKKKNDFCKSKIEGDCYTYRKNVFSEIPLLFQCISCDETVKRTRTRDKMLYEKREKKRTERNAKVDDGSVRWMVVALTYNMPIK